MTFLNKEAAFQRFESVLARRERIRYLIKGFIQTNSRPNVLVKSGDSWAFPSLKSE
jgi:hypothetical protein